MDRHRGNWFENVEVRPAPWPGLTWLTAAIVVEDVSRAIDFYTTAMPFVSIFELSDGKPGSMLFARMRYRGSNFTLNQVGFDPDLSAPGEGNPVSFAFYLYVDAVADLVASMEQYGATTMIPTRREFWGDERARVRDPFGYIWDLAKRVE